MEVASRPPYAPDLDPAEWLRQAGRTRPADAATDTSTQWAPLRQASGVGPMAPAKSTSAPIIRPLSPEASTSPVDEPGELCESGCGKHVSAASPCAQRDAGASTRLSHPA